MLFLNEDTKYIGDNYSPYAGKYSEEMDALVESAGIPLQAFEDYFNDDPRIAAVEILSEMNSGWNALERDMILTEAHLTIQGIPLQENAFTDTLKSWFKKIGEFFSKVWASITNFFKKVWTWITTKFQNAEKWYKENKSKFKIHAVSIETYPNLINGSFLNVKFDNYLKDPSDNEEAYKNAKENLDKSDKLSSFEIKGAIFGAYKKAKITVKDSDCEKIILGNKKILADLNKDKEEQAKNAKTAIDAAKKGEAEASKGSDEAAKKNAAKFAAKLQWCKKKQSILQEIIKQKISAASEACSTAFKAAKYMYYGLEKGEESKGAPKAAEGEKFKEDTLDKFAPGSNAPNRGNGQSPSSVETEKGNKIFDRAKSGKNTYADAGDFAMSDNSAWDGSEASNTKGLNTGKPNGPNPDKKIKQARRQKTSGWAWNGESFNPFLFEFA